MLPTQLDNRLPLHQMMHLEAAGDLKPEASCSTRGPEIETYIEDLKGERRNILQGINFYIVVTYSSYEAENVELACSITDVTGQLITGQRFQSQAKASTISMNKKLNGDFLSKRICNQVHIL